MRYPIPRSIFPLLFLSAHFTCLPGTRAAELASLEAEFRGAIHPILNEFCLQCHSTEKHKGDLDLERFSSFSEIAKHPKVWETVIEQLTSGEMPPKEKPQPTPAQRQQLLNWINGGLDQIALSRAGDPGPVVLRRLSNAEYTYTIRDLTGVGSLNPAAEFPVDSASGEGFMNVGNSLVMSPALITKYLDAGKEVASHAMLLPDGIRFSSKNTRRDWTEELLSEIRAFYGRFSEPGGGSAVNLQGIKFDTKDGGVIPLTKYLSALLDERTGALIDAAKLKLSPRYLAKLRETLNGTEPSILLDPIRARWGTAKPEDAPAVAAAINQWQQNLWKFNSVGHIGKANGPKGWLEPLSPLASRYEARLKLPSSDRPEITLYLSAGNAGDGDDHDFVVWQEPRLVAPGKPTLLLRNVRHLLEQLTVAREQIFASTTKALAAAAEVRQTKGGIDLTELARKHSMDPDILAAWLDYLGLGVNGAVKIDSYFTDHLAPNPTYDFINGWGSSDTPLLVANSSGQHVRIPGNMKPHSVAMHPSPKLQAAVGWRSPVAGAIRIDATVQHAHPECGNGVTWSLELRRGWMRQRLASGVAQGGREVKVAPVENLRVHEGDLISLLIGPRDSNHSCDLTAVDLVLTGDGREWNLASDVSPDVLAGNPHADRFNNDAVWHFYTEPVNANLEIRSPIPAGSLLARWESATDPAEQQEFAAQLQRLLASPVPKEDGPDKQLYKQLTSLGGSLLSRARQKLGSNNNGESADLSVRAPSVIEVTLPTDLVAGYEFVTTGILDPERGAEGSVQLQVLTNKPPDQSKLLLAGATDADLSGPWSSNNRRVLHSAPIIANDGSQKKQRLEAEFDEFRQIFPAALCYTKIVPVDEVVTLTLFYREDDHLIRLMLDEAQTSELERLWSELHFVSHDALTLVDVFEQLWQYATQDADPKVFEPLREPIRQRASEFRQWLTNTEPKHLEAVVEFADRAYRRPLTSPEKSELHSLYGKLRAEGLAHDETIRLMVARLFVAPAFLYHAEKPGPGQTQVPVNDWELANRLSYFLWSSAPDAELRAAAEAGALHHDDALIAQTRRMLRDPRVRRLATEFACAWLHIYGFDELSEKSERHFPTFNNLRGSMYEESIRFFTDFFQNDRSILDILNADYTFVNAPLAEHYAIRGISGTEWRRIDGLKDLGRGGILGQAAVLAKQSGASRTSPILRGNWISEVLLGERLPRPPKDVPLLPEDEATETLTVRELTEKHSSDPRCASCHVRIDPFGFALEKFDAIGRRRERDLGDRSINVSAKTLDGAEFYDITGLRDYLLNQRRDAFLKQFCRKLLGYSLGRAVQLSDGPLIKEMLTRLKAEDHEITVAIETIVLSPQFRQIRGRDFPAD